MSKKTVTAAPADDLEDDVEIVEETGFTPEEEAALDAAAKGDDAKVEVEPAAEPVKKQAPTVTKKDDAPKPEEEIETLKKRLADSEAKTSAAEKARDEALQSRVKKLDDVEADEATRIQAADEKVASDIELATRDVKDLNKELREAKENGDVDKELEVNDKLLDAKIKLKGLEGAKGNYEKWKDGRKDFWTAERKKAEKKAQSTSEVDFNPDVYTPKALGWIDKHPEFKTNKDFNAKAIRAHHAAVGEGIAEDSDAYFDFLDKRLGFAEADEASEDEAQAEAATVVVQPTPKKAKLQTQLPPSRTATTQVRPEGTRTVKKLTPAEVEAAEISGMSPEEYWDDKYGNKQ